MALSSSDYQKNQREWAYPVVPTSSRAFANLESCHLICSHLNAADLCRLSRVSKQWESEASALIWRELPSIAPIASVLQLSSTSLVQHPSALHGKFIQQLARARNRGRLVRKLTITPSDMEPGTARLTVLAIAFKTSVFPFLREAIIFGLPVYHANDLQKVLPGSLAALDVRGADTHAWAFVASRRASLRSLRIEGKTFIPRDVCRRFSDLRAMTEVDMTVPYCPPILPHLARCPSLRVLRLHTGESDMRGTTVAPSQGFRALRRLLVEGRSAAIQARGIIQSLSVLHPLEEVRLENAGAHGTPASMNEDHFMAVLIDIEKHCDPKALRTLVLTPRIPGQASASHKPSDASYLRPLASFSSLETLVLASWNGLALKNADCLAIATCWPHIRVLRLCNLRAGENLPTLHGLVPLADKCPELEELALAVDAQSAAPRLPAHYPRSRSRVKTLAMIGPSPIHGDTVLGAARFLATLFPHLRDISCPDGSPHKRCWADVSDRLAVAHAVAIQTERELATGSREAPDGGVVQSVAHALVKIEQHDATVVAPIGPTRNVNTDVVHQSTMPPPASESSGYDNAVAAMGDVQLTDVQRRSASQQRVDELQKCNAELEKDRASLEKRYRTMNSRLEGDIHGLQHLNADLQKQKTDIEQKYLQVEEERDVLGKQILRLQRDLEETSRNASTNLDALIEQLGKLEQHRDQVEKRCADLERWKGECKQRLQGLVSLG
ncbi:hypothetical protein BD626DRAFT_635571 [Schizophyllum amplum]|uniref:F-box domain-containing protein n=1 Tax=Schizophyllum amplum TaxID=97359 RepID=A0A550BVW4_9AGAR|nr:hypothetical protein BD626DRAFT_635571 [Auriculariopsis ampla]